MRRTFLIGLTAVSVGLAGGLLVRAQEGKEVGEQERTVTEAEVPPAALAALKKLAGSAVISEFSEEIEHGHKFYEASWKGPDGNVDALVTETGDPVEIEETVSADDVPAAVRAALEKVAGKDAAIRFEKKTYLAYEAHFKKDGKHHEVMVTPDGRRYREAEDDDEQD
jgi:hypothetical protein